MNAASGKIVAEYVKLGGIRHDDPPKYDLVIDRISHEVPFYRATLKRMALEGTIIINNPFWWSADDKFFNYSLAPEARRGSSQDGAAAAEGLHSRHRQRESAQPRVSARLARHHRLRRSSGVSETFRWRRLEECFEGQFTRGALARVRPDRNALHDAAGSRSILNSLCAVTA